MVDILIRDVPDHVLRILDGKARRLGLSRTEYVRRQLAAEADGEAVSAEDLAHFGKVFGDLSDPDVMTEAWG